MYSGTLTRAYGARLATLLGTASFLTMGNAIDAHAQAEVAQAEEIPETVLITGSLIRGTAAVGVPVTNLSPMDFAVSGALTTAGLATLLTNALPIAAGMIVFAEPLPGGWTGAIRIVAFGAVIAGAVLLAVRAKAAEPAPGVEDLTPAPSPT